MNGFSWSAEVCTTSWDKYGRRARRISVFSKRRDRQNLQTRVERGIQVEFLPDNSIHHNWLSASWRRERKSAGFEEGGDEGYGQADHVEVVALDARDPAGCAALNGVGAGFVHGFAGGDVGGDLLVGEGKKADGGDLRGNFRRVGGDRSEEHTSELQ